MRTTQKFQPHGVLPQIFNRSCSQICCPVSGGTYQDIREVTTERNDARNIGACLNSEAECTKRIPKRPFLPYLFPREGKDMAVGDTSEMTTTERAAASDVSFPLCSFLLFSKPQTEFAVWVFHANLQQQSLSRFRRQFPLHKGALGCAVYCLLL